MRVQQTHTPKYWVVNDANDCDVMMSTMRKSRGESIKAYVEGLKRTPLLTDLDEEDVAALYYDNPNLECVLVEIKLVERSE